MENVTNLTWGYIKKLKVVGIDGDCEREVSLGWLLGSLGYPTPHGRKVVGDYDISKIRTLLLEQGYCGYKLPYLEVTDGGILAGFLSNLETKLRGKGVLYGAFVCNVTVDDRSFDVALKDLIGLKFDIMNYVLLSLRGDDGRKVDFMYDFYDLFLKTCGFPSFWRDYVRSPLWYDDYIEYLYDCALRVLQESVYSSLKQGMPLDWVLKKVVG